jgi:2-(3-amino-3-carboxypropyl)histidine synthase
MSLVKSATPKKKFRAQTIPLEILNDENLNLAIQNLPANYNFEIHKTVWQIRSAQAKRVALQFPEGLLMYSLTISDILTAFCNVEILVMGNVTYGACCIDDKTAVGIGCDFMVHYGHSCLIPVSQTLLKTMYVFVDIQIDVNHCVDSVLHNLPAGKKIALVSTIQFVASLPIVVKMLESTFTITVPQSKPLSRGEILGCTAPSFDGNDLIL